MPPGTDPAGVRVDFDVPATMRDGTILRANVYRPAATGTWPVLLTRLPYGKDLPIGSLVLDPVQAARRGYIVVVQDTRGRFASDGEFYPDVYEADDGADSVSWAAGLQHADGSVGMYGASYFGRTQWLAAMMQPPALRAIVPLVTGADPTNGPKYRGGAFELGMRAHWHARMGFDVLARRYKGNADAIREAKLALAQDLDALTRVDGYGEEPPARVPHLSRHGIGQEFYDSVERGLHPGWAARAAIAGHHPSVNVPSYNISGWYDFALGGTLKNFEAMRALGRPTKLLLGPWSHIAWIPGAVGDVDFGAASHTGSLDLKDDLVSLHLRWFDHWLKGRATGIMDEPAVRIFVMGRDHWRDEHEWPLARAVATEYHLRAGGGLTAEAPDADPASTFDYDPRQPVPTHGGPLLMAYSFRPGSVDQRRIEERRDVLVFTTRELTRDVEVTGPVRVRLYAASTARDTDFVARLCDVYPDGSSLNVTDGIVRSRHRGRARGEPASLIEPGRAYEYDIDLWATSRVFLAGHRIRMQITSSCFPRWDRNRNTGSEPASDTGWAIARQTILHDAEHPSRVILPVVPA